MALYGIDISQWQGNDVMEGDFTIIKATEGVGFVDPTCDIKYQKSKKAGKLLGVYHFARPDLGNSAQDEAKFFVDNIKGYIGEALIVLDWEKSVNNVSWAKAFLDKVYSLTGIRPLIYMSASVVNGYNWSTVAPYYGLWIAGYPAKYNVANPPRPAADELAYGIGAWKFAAMWQYTSSAGSLDRNIFYGDKKAWKAYASKPTATTEKNIEKEAAATTQKPEKKDDTVTTTTTTTVETKVPDALPEDTCEGNHTNGGAKPLSGSTDRGLSLDKWNTILDKAEKTIELVEETAKATGFTIKMSNKVYDVLKVIAVAVLPAISALYLGLANIWGFGLGEQIDQTIQLIIAAINTVLGLAIIKSSSDYKKN